MAIVEPLVVAHLDLDVEPAPEPAVEVDEVRIQIVEQGSPGLQPKRDRQSTAERLDEAAGGMRGPERRQVRHLPALAAGPLERGSQRGRGSGGHRGESTLPRRASGARTGLRRCSSSLAPDVFAKAVLDRFVTALELRDKGPETTPRRVGCDFSCLEGTARGITSLVSDRHILLSVLFFHEPDNPGVWVAQALEHDIAAYGPDLPSAKTAFERTVVGYFQLAVARQQEPLSSLKPAAEVFWRIWREKATQEPRAERVPSLDAFMVQAVTHEPISASV